MDEEVLEGVYNSPEYYVNRIFQDALLPRYNDIRRNNGITKIFYFIDLPNVFLGHFSQSRTKEKKDKKETDISGSHSGGDRICNIMVETLLNILFHLSYGIRKQPSLLLPSALFKCPQGFRTTCLLLARWPAQRRHGPYPE